MAQSVPAVLVVVVKLLKRIISTCVRACVCVCVHVREIGNDNTRFWFMNASISIPTYRQKAFRYPRHFRRLLGCATSHRRF
mmetsp:Transcript_18162/g.27695  ORF Transcript_18162/g.27695 Transcript_18162/m.27695 type:complete len:81 (-) Transcript_18162:1306-1548(-)